ncbi:MAG TPA: 2-amino-4-hydroxy-6-hydroxymethyldihydropteridine diphosphokinase [Acidimicrobiales bacterium]|jgi:2-amino-4-hydroxy-6-hydroxymethyldihydropteridine diphosphokinase|nr:2-amino-4-hydroxy-6-hydroxymethyldihydropteridine diphosphokinase [Acidimicrobiaceae bacterium]MDP6176484.1 2-amino-4-hydroxy-6-hydroxymethyldihydropteridine diphosphokinase [Acidimicrobiales bacterium]MDP6281981.1 2-amino-4-hydroxy-6-hydroxymethyldihydropteridine diphosphokinase [Acidimicrobiales bacterium]MDP7116650.1 2-amino-4-hydroxy-6-hydroxymethyldihydropteridine diphosphokinase [Acidimicrobiales bacterium]MDP7410629.1 2-amino-4-hydroxy-6-hydroxymethyldihydropteridine diphosphokinase [|tara:strand:- start:5663 stop:6151 length:489 start_codon:yes stop_codon:yes gene_type:complete
MSGGAGPTRRALLSLGSNVGDRWEHLRGAVAAMPDVVDVSTVYETAPVGGPDQGPYLNCVVRLQTDLSPKALLELCRGLEVEAGRVRRVRWGPRTLDVDILWVDGESVDDEGLTVPHPRMFERAFVLVPLRDVAPDLVDEIPGGTAGDDVVPVGPLAEPAGA